MLKALLLVPREGDAPETSGVVEGPRSSTENRASEPASTSRPRPFRLEIQPLAPAAASERDRSARHGASAERLGFELSVVTSARAGDGQYGLGLAVLPVFRVEDWLAGLELSAQSYVTETAEPSAPLEVAGLIGRRLRFDAVSLDLIAGPGVVVQSESSVETGPAGVRRQSMTGVVPRLLVKSHMGFAERSVLRGFVGIEGEVGPPQSDASFGPPLPPMWVMGLALGATVGTR